MSTRDHDHPVSAQRVADARAGLLSVSEAGRLAGLLGMLADPVPITDLFALVAAGELCVGDLALALEVTEDQVSYALKMLRLAGLVSFRKDGRLVCYRLRTGSRTSCSSTACASCWPSPPRRPTMRVLDALGHALAVAGSMTWQITWSLILGFTLSAVVQAVVRRPAVIRLLGDDRPGTLALADRARRGLVLLLVRGGGAGPVAVPQGRQLHRRDGVRDRQHQPGHRAGHHPGSAALLAVHPGGVRRRPDHDHPGWRWRSGCSSASGCSTPPAPRRTRGWPGPWKATRPWT